MEESATRSVEFNKKPFYYPTSDYFILIVWGIAATFYGIWRIESDQVGWVILMVAFASFITGSVLYFNIPEKIIVDEKGFSLNDLFVPWETVSSILFTFTAGKSLPTIVVSCSDMSRTVKLYPKFYKKKKDLRNLFEEIAVAKRINVIVEDRGIY